MATTKSTDANQYRYLTNLAAGKTSAGGTANAGQQNWAKQQLARQPFVPAQSAVKVSSSTPKTFVPPSQAANAKPATTAATSTATSTQTAPTSMTAPFIPEMPRSRTNITLDTLGNKINADPFQFKGPEAFSYDPNTDPAYQAALATAQANIAQQQADTGARLRASGQGKSSYSEQVANQIGAKEMARVSTEVVPQLLQQAYGRYADQANRDMQTQQLNYGAQQDQISSLATLYGLQDKQDFQNPITEAQLTGNYMSGEARQYMDAIMDLKRQAETPGISAEQRSVLSKQADQYRSALQGLGVDPSLFGSNVHSSKAVQNISSAGARTLAGQAQDLANREFNVNAALQFGDRAGMVLSPQQDISGLFRQMDTGITAAGTPVQRSLQGQQFDRGMLESDRNFERGVLESDRNYNYQVGRDAVQDKQWLDEFNQRVDQYGVQNALAWAAQNLNEREFEDQSAYRWAGLDAELAAAASQGEKYSGMSANDVVSNVRKNFENPSGKLPALTDSNGGLTTDAEKIYMQIISAGLPDAQEAQALAAIGLTPAQIKSLDDKFLTSTTGNQ